MYLETRAKVNYWATENFCGKWSLRTGTLIITTITTIWSIGCMVWSLMVYLFVCYAPGSNCWYMPGPEVKTLEKLMPNKSVLALRVAIMFVGVFHCLYLVASTMVFIGVYKKSATLLSLWVALTSLYMAMDLFDLFVTLPYTTLIHLLITLAHFIAALCAWVVVKSHRQQLRLMKSKPPVPEDALLDYTVDGIDKFVLDPIP